MSSDGNRRRYLSYEERVLWTTVTKAIKPLAVNPAPTGEASAEVTADKQPAKSAAKPAPRAAKLPKPLNAPPLAPHKPAPPSLEPLTRRMRGRVARGKQAIDARLDLHGLTQDEAHGALLRFLRSAGARGARLVLVITGKGSKNLGGRGVLKQQVPHWLSLPEFRSLVVGFEDAHIAHGGEGALYVRVRRASGDQAERH